MKIVVVNKFFYHKGGADRTFFDHMRLLSSHGHEVIPFSMKHPNNAPSPYERYFVSEVNYRTKNPFRLISAALALFYSFEAKRKFEQLIRDTRPDIVHIHNIYHQISPSILGVCKKFRIPVVQSVHDYKLICPNYKLFANGKIDESCRRHQYWNDVRNRSLNGSLIWSIGAVLEMYVHKIFRVFERSVAVWIAPSEFVRQKLIQFGMPPKRIVTMRHFLDVSEIEPVYEPGSYIAYVGRLSEEKGIDVLIRALAHISVPLKIIGSGPCEERLRRLAWDQGVAGKIEWIPHMSHDRLFECLKGAALIVVPSIWHEVFGYVVLEGFALGKPVLVANRGALPEIVSPVSSELIFPSDNAELLAIAIHKLMQNPRKMKEIGVAGRLMVESHYNPEDYYPRLMALYADCIRHTQQY